MNERKPNKKPVPSYDLENALFNAEKLDEIVTSESLTYVDRMGKIHYTRKGLDEAAVSAGPTVEAAIRANEQANEAKKNSDDILAATAQYIESAKTSAEASSHSADESAASAEQAKGEAQCSSNSADRAERIQYSGKPYNDVAAAQAAITAGTETSRYFYIRSNAPEVLIEEYENVSGIATRTYRGMASSQSVIELNLWVGTRVYTSLNNVSNYYIPLRGANIGKLMPIASSQGQNVVTYFPVTPGQTYIIKASDLRSDYLAVALKEDNLLTETTLGLVTLSGTGAYRTFTVPKDSPAKFAFMNVVIAFGSFDIRSNISVSVDVVKSINGIEIYDDYARNHLIDNSVRVIEETGGQMYDPVNNVPGYYIRATGANAGRIETAEGTALTMFPVVPGTTYTIEASSFNPLYFVLALKTNNLLTGATLGVTALSGTDGTRSFTVPPDSPAKFAFMNIKLPGANWDIASGLWISGLIKKIVTLKDYGIYDETARKLIAQLSSSISRGSVLTGKSWAVIGDSITEKNFRTNKNYHDFIAENVGGMSIYNYGISGSGYHDRSGVANNITQTPDYVTVFFGTNDWGQVRNSKPLGAFLDTGTDTISGCINTCLLGVITKFYSKRIAVFTPLPRVTNWGSNASPNVVGYTLEQLATLIKRYAEHYSIPCLDLYHSSNLPVYTTEGNKLYFTAPTLTTPDGLHPNDAGHKVMAGKIQKFLESI